MRCPFCGGNNDRVTDTRASQDGSAIRRRRECLDCRRRYTTYERIEHTTVKIVKKDGTREPFDHSKMKQGLEKACWKRPISDAQIEAIIADLRDLGVQRAAPCHCTGDQARQAFADAFGADCTLAGVGQVFVMEEGAK